MESEARVPEEHPFFLAVFLAGLLVTSGWTEHGWQSNYEAFSVSPQPGPRTWEHVAKNQLLQIRKAPSKRVSEESRWGKLHSLRLGEKTVIKIYVSASSFKLKFWCRREPKCIWAQPRGKAVPGAHPWLRFWVNQLRGSATIAPGFSLSKVVLNSGQIHFPWEGKVNLITPWMSTLLSFMGFIRCAIGQRLHELVSSKAFL